jgi:pimeloyl-ACP methyl ester carboxylesterase
VIPVVRLADLPRHRHLGPVRVPLYSPHLGVRKSCGVLLPPHYRRGERLPVVYLFRGHHLEWLSPHEDASRRFPLPEQVQHAMEKGQLPPMVLVIPCLGSDNRRYFSSAVDWKFPELAPPGRGMGRGLFESYLLEDVIARIEEVLEVSARPRIAIGFSLGGLTALQLALRHPALFSHVAAYDASLFYDPPDPRDSVLRNAIFTPGFGQPRDMLRVRVHSPTWLARHLPQEKLAGVAFYLQSGPRPSEPFQSNYYRNQGLVRVLAARGVPNHLPAVDPKGRHNWATADRFGMRVCQQILLSQRGVLEETG